MKDISVRNIGGIVAERCKRVVQNDLTAYAPGAASAR